MSSTFSVSKRAAEPNQKSLIQQYIDDSVDALTISARAFCAPATKSVVYRNRPLNTFYCRRLSSAGNKTSWMTRADF